MSDQVVRSVADCGKTGVQRVFVELVVHLAHRRPERHVVAVFPVQMGAHIAIRRENHFLALIVKVLDDVVDVAAGDDQSDSALCSALELIYDTWT